MIFENNCYKRKRMFRISNIITILALILYVALYVNGNIKSFNNNVVVLILIFLEFSYIKEYMSFLKNSKLETKLKYTDLHTGLYNKSGCEKLFEEFTPFTKSSSSYILIFDLNDLKKVNDNVGHKYGDDLIRDFATILNMCSSEILDNSFVGRFGGDEFIVFFFTNNKDIADVFLDRVCELVQTFNCCNEVYKISYAVGCAYSNDYEKNISIRELLEIADKSMYKNKYEKKYKCIKNHF